MIGAAVSGRLRDGGVAELHVGMQLSNGASVAFDVSILKDQLQVGLDSP